MWKLRLLALLLISGGIGLLAFGVHIEISLAERRGSGFRRFMGNVFYSGDIDNYRSMAFHAMVFAPGLIVLGFGIWALVSWIKRARRARRMEAGLLALKPAARKVLIERGLSGRKLARELERLNGPKGKRAAKG